MAKRASDKGARAYRAGRAAEEAVAQRYRDQGFEIIAQRWRGAGGEIDLIVCRDDQIVFVEVKQSRTHAEAAQHLNGAQQGRIYRAAEAFLARYDGNKEVLMRFDVALVDQFGVIDVLENAFGMG
ncbi:hypothetical protein GG681_13930 [Epibacterium sp. SM1969]|uniref:UPF0102 protein GG681_13930 n=1 Tax=Tritonibacter aquimaris TaxID=2663379 RepID=A0A844AN89_9RHOB|nr:YraN family protein [Tritonibacter aquimaris]MQY43739.1 hypothetical protein [Tritonibacter aquimaris]